MSNQSRMEFVLQDDALTIKNTNLVSIVNNVLAKNKIAKKKVVDFASEIWINS